MVYCALPCDIDLKLFTYPNMLAKGTIADIAVGYALQFGARLGLSDRYKPNCLRYLANLNERQAYKRSQEKGKLTQ